MGTPNGASGVCCHSSAIYWNRRATNSRHLCARSEQAALFSAPPSCPALHLCLLATLSLSSEPYLACNTNVVYVEEEGEDFAC